MNSLRGREAEAAEGPSEAHEGDLAGVVSWEQKLPLFF